MIFAKFLQAKIVRIGKKKDEYALKDAIAFSKVSND